MLGVTFEYTTSLFNKAFGTTNLNTLIFMITVYFIVVAISVTHRLLSIINCIKNNTQLNIVGIVFASISFIVCIVSIVMSTHTLKSLMQNSFTKRHTFVCL